MKIFKKHWVTIFVSLIFLGILFINYLDVLKFQYPVPPGEDPVTHISITKDILEKGKSSTSGYPPGFHYIIAGLSSLFNADPIKTMVYFYPILMFLSALAVYLFARQFFGQATGILTLVLYAFLSSQPRQSLSDGLFPNIIAADFIMILGFLFFLRAYQQERLKDILLGGLFLGLVPFFHHLSSYLMVILLIVLLISLLLLSFFKKENFKKKMLVLALTLFVAFLIGAYPAYIYFGKASLDVISSNFIAYAASWDKFVAQAKLIATAAPPIPWSDYSLILSPFLWFLGLLSLPFLLKGFVKDKKEEFLLIFVWLLVVFLLSRPSVFSILPNRFARELAIPLAFCSGIFLKEIFVFFKGNWSRAILGILIGIFVIKGFLGLFGWVGKYNQQVFITDLDKQALDWIKENTAKNSVVLVAPFNGWVGLLTGRAFQEIGADLEKLKNGDYLYVNRFQNAWLWREKKDYLEVRGKIKEIDNLKLIKNFGAEDEKGIAIYEISR